MITLYNRRRLYNQGKRVPLTYISGRELYLPSIRARYPDWQVAANDTNLPTIGFKYGSQVTNSNVPHHLYMDAVEDEG